MDESNDGCRTSASRSSQEVCKSVTECHLFYKACHLSKILNGEEAFAKGVVGQRLTQVGLMLPFIFFLFSFFLIFTGSKCIKM